MKKLTRAEMQKDAERMMKAHNKKQVFATQDNNFFFEKNPAVNHNHGLKVANKDEDLEVYEFTAPVEEGAADEATEPITEPTTTETTTTVPPVRPVTPETPAGPPVPSMELVEAGSAYAQAKEAADTAAANLDKHNQDCEAAKKAFGEAYKVFNETTKKADKEAASAKCDELSKAHQALLDKTADLERIANETKDKAAELEAALLNTK